MAGAAGTNRGMNLYRRNEVYIDNEIRFYATLRAKQLIGDTEASMTIDQVINNELRNVWTNANPEWVLAWEKREEMRQAHKKEIEKLEAEAVK
jgi:hypothetical protein